MCDEGIAIVVKDGGGNVQLWCLGYFTGMLPDDMVMNIHAKPGSLCANHSQNAKDEKWYSHEICFSTDWLTSGDETEESDE